MMNSALGTATTHTQISAAALNLESLSSSTRVTTFFRVANVITNVIEIFDSKADADHRLEDAG